MTKMNVLRSILKINMNIKNYINTNTIIIFIVGIIIGYWFFNQNQNSGSTGEWEVVSETPSEPKPQSNPLTYYCTEEDVAALNFYLNVEGDIFDKARAIDSMSVQGGECILKYPSLIRSAHAIVEKEKSLIGLDNYNIETVMSFEKTNGSKGFETEITDFKKELDDRMNKELDKIFNK
jgi:hypothetical protein